MPLGLSVPEKLLKPGYCVFPALRSVIRGVDKYVVNAVDEVWHSLSRPLDALAMISARFGVLRLIDRELSTLIVDEALRELVGRRGSLVNVRILINDTVVKPEDLVKVGDYVDVVVVTDEGSVMVKAWVVKELLRVMGLVRT